jgi:hypothetical protein
VLATTVMADGLLHGHRLYAGISGGFGGDHASQRPESGSCRAGQAARGWTGLRRWS